MPASKAAPSGKPMCHQRYVPPGGAGCHEISVTPETIITVPRRIHKFAGSPRNKIAMVTLKSGWEPRTVVPREAPI